MANRFRFVLVGTLAALLLSTPLFTEAVSKKSSTTEVLDLSDTVAGLSTDFVVHGKSTSPVEALVLKPDGNELTMESVTDAEGYADFTISGQNTQTAGLYHVQARLLGHSDEYSPSQSFEVHAGSFSGAQSSASLVKKSAQVGETLELKVQVKDEFRNPLASHVIKVAASENILKAYSPAASTDANGEMKFYLEGLEPGLVELRVFDASANQTIGEDLQVGFLQSTQTAEHVDRGGWDDDFVILTEESGPIAALELSADPNQEIGKAFDVTVTAVDAEGLTVTDYTGVVRFSSTDAEATLPNDYTFLAQDLGVHEFSLAVTFVEPGEQILSVNDIDLFNISGESAFTVTEGDVEADLGDEFVVDEFEREGDFTLLAPASGTYSQNSLDVEGEAEYGNYALIYLNGEEVDRVAVDFDNTFTGTLSNLEDGTYVVYVDIVTLSDEEDIEDAEITEIIESSASETFTIDSTAPEIVSITADPSEGFTGGESVKVTVLTESNLQEGNLLFESQLYPLEESSTPGKYEATLLLPEENGEYPLDVILMDELGNEVQYRDQLTFNVGGGTPDLQEQVTGLSVTPIAGGVNLSWEAISNADVVDHYRVHYGPTETTLFASTDTFDKSTSWSITGLTPGQEHYFAVSAMDADGNEGPQSEAVKGVPLATEAQVDEEIPQIETRPEISDSDLPPTQPDSGPELFFLLLLSLLGSGTYVFARKATS